MFKLCEVDKVHHLVRWELFQRDLCALVRLRIDFFEIQGPNKKVIEFFDLCSLVRRPYKY